MPRYIDADELPNIYTATHQELVLALEEAETADVVEVVRCKDCVYWDVPGYCVDFMTQDEDGFCKWGERREDVKVHQCRSSG